MSIWMKVALFFTRMIHTIKKALGMSAAPAALPESGSGFSFATIKKAEELNKFEKYKEKSAGLNDVVKMTCGDKCVFVKMAEGRIEVKESSLEPTVTVKFTESGWAAITTGEDVKKLIMNGDVQFGGNLAGIMSHMAALKLLFLCVTGNLDTSKLQ
jgi:hypothetical protein